MSISLSQTPKTGFNPSGPKYDLEIPHLHKMYDTKEENTQKHRSGLFGIVNAECYPFTHRRLLGGGGGICAYARREVPKYHALVLK